MGDELANEEAVRGQTLATARDLVFRTRMDSIRSWFDCSFEVTDESGRTVLTMPFSEVVQESEGLAASSSKMFASMNTTNGLPWGKWAPGRRRGAGREAV